MTELTADQAMQTAREHHAAGRMAEAQRICREVLAKCPEQPAALHMLGVIAFAAGRSDEAIAFISRAAASDPSHPDYHNDLAEVLRAAGRPGAAAEACLRAIAFRPDFPEAFLNLGVSLQQLGQSDEATACYRQAVELRPDFAAAMSNLGAALKDQVNLDEAVACCRRAIDLEPNLIEAYSNLATVLRAQGRYDEAIAICRQAIAREPDHAVVHWNLAMSLLLQGDFENGWPEFEWRMRDPHLAGPVRTIDCPRWDGLDPLQKTILVYAEQGFGDVIQFARYVPLLAQRGAKVIFECPPELVTLMGSLAGAGETIRVVRAGELVNDVDACVPLMSLAILFDTTLRTLSALIPYLSPPPEKVAYWRHALAIDSPSGLRVGLVWAGNAAPDPMRSCPLAALAPLVDVPGVAWHSLQIGPGSQQLFDLPQRMPMLDRTSELQDFSDTAALAANLDLVITIDTGVAHLCGAIGLRTWTMLPFAPDWRWFLDRGDSPWYPTMRLFRQERRGDWESIIARLARDLAMLVADGPTPA